MSSFGATIGLVSFLFFIFLLWEAFTSKRAIIRGTHMSSMLEWVRISYPRKKHTHMEAPFIFKPDKEKEKKEGKASPNPWR